jgi:hypothetical protein
MKIRKAFNTLLIISLLTSVFPLITVAQAPSKVDLIYQADSYVPPFYKGKGLNPNQGLVTVLAISGLKNSTGEVISAKNTIYKWKKNGLVLQSSSGQGKDSITFRGGVPLKDTVIEVSVSSLDGSISSTNTLDINNTQTQIVFYESSPVYGIRFNHALPSNVALLGNELVILAMPYFYSTNVAADENLNYTWSIDENKTENQSPKNSFTTRIDNPGSGVANVNLKINNKALIFQVGTNNYKINFSKQ